MNGKMVVLDETDLLIFSHYITRKEHIYQDIFQLYVKKELDYYKAYKEAGIDLLKGNYGYTFERTLCFQKVFSIFLHSNQSGDYEPLYTLIRKGYKNVWNYFKQHRELFDGEDFLEYTLKGNKNRKITNSNMAEYYFVARTLADVKGMDIQDFDEIMDISVDIGLNGVAPYLKDEFEDSQKGNRGRSINELEAFPKFIPLLKSLQKEQTVHQGIFAYLHQLVDKDIKAEEQRLKNQPFHVMQSFHKDLINEDIEVECQCPNCRAEKLQDKHKELTKEYMTNSFLEYYFAIGQIFEASEFDVMNYTNYLSFNKEEISYLIKVLKGFEYSGYSEEVIDCMLFVAIFAMVAKKEYSKLRDYAFSQKREDLMLQIEQNKEQYQNLLKEKQTEIDKLKNTEKGYLHRIGSLNEEVESIKAKNRQLQQSLDKTEKNNKEVKALRRFLMQNEQQDVTEAVDHTEKYIKELSKRKILVIGGHHKWQQKMKEILPSITLVYTDEAEKGIANVEQYDVIFMNTTVMSHGAYYRIIPHLEKTSVPFYFLSGVVNKYRNLAEMYELITGNLPNQYTRQKSIGV